MESQNVRSEAEAVLCAEAGINQAKILNLGADNHPEWTVALSLADPAASTPESDAIILKAARKAVIKKLGKGVVPKKWLIPDDVLPTLPESSEVDEKRLRAKILGEDDAAATLAAPKPKRKKSSISAPPPPPTEPAGSPGARIRENVAVILDTEPALVDMGKPFTKIGGDSITAIELMSKLMEYDIVLQLPALVGSKTLADIAKAVEKEQAEDEQDDARQQESRQTVPAGRQPIAV